MDLNALRAKLSGDINVRDLLKLLRTPIGKGKKTAAGKPGADAASPEKAAAQAKPEVTPAQAIRSALRIVGIVTGIAIALGAIPWWFGKRTEAAYEAVLARAAGPFVTIKPVSYERGWLGSRAETEISFGGNAARITLASIIHHGPFPGFGDRDFTPRLGVIETQIVGRIAGLPQLASGKARGEMSLRGDAQIKVDMQARDFDMINGTRITLRPLNGTVTLSADGAMRSEWKTPLLRAAASFGLLGAESVALTLTRQKGKPDTTEMSIGTLAYDTLDDSFRADKLKISFAGAGTEQRVRFAAPGVRFGTLAWGPGEFELAARRLDMRAVARFVGTLTARDKGKEKKPVAPGEALLELARNIAKQKTEIEIPAFSIVTPQGNIGAQTKLAMATLAGDNNSTPSPIHILRLSRANLDVRVPGGVLRAYSDERQRMRLESLRTGGTLKPEAAAALTPERIAATVAEQSETEAAQLAARWHLVPAPEGHVLSLNIADGQMLINGVPGTYTPGPVAPAAAPAPAP